MKGNFVVGTTGMYFTGLVVGVIFTFAFIAAMFDLTDQMYDRAIEKGYAHYHPKTGELMWDDENVKYVVEGK